MYHEPQKGRGYKAAEALAADVAAVSKCCESVRLLGHDMAQTMCGLEVKHECRMSTTEPQKVIVIIANNHS